MLADCLVVTSGGPRLRTKPLKQARQSRANPINILYREMKRPSLDLRLRKAGKTIAEELGVDPPPLIRIARGRLTIRFRQLGASRWSETDRMEHAFEIAATVRAILAAHSRWVLR